MRIIYHLQKHTACLALLLTGCVSLTAYASTNVTTTKAIATFSENRSISSNPSAVNIFAGTGEAQTY